jgi:hypothetical protein
MERARRLAALGYVALAADPYGDGRQAQDLPQAIELMTAVRKPLIVDLYDPFILSDLEFYGDRFARAGGRPLLALRWLQHHLANGDFFLCASERQRDLWLGAMLMERAIDFERRVFFRSRRPFETLAEFCQDELLPFVFADAEDEREHCDKARQSAPRRRSHHAECRDQ